MAAHAAPRAGCRFKPDADHAQQAGTKAVVASSASSSAENLTSSQIMRPSGSSHPLWARHHARCAESSAGGGCTATMRACLQNHGTCTYAQRALVHRTNFLHQQGCVRGKSNGKDNCHRHAHQQRGRMEHGVPFRARLICSRQLGTARHSCSVMQPAGMLQFFACSSDTGRNRAMAACA